MREGVVVDVVRAWYTRLYHIPGLDVLANGEATARSIKERGGAFTGVGALSELVVLEWFDCVGEDGHTDYAQHGHLLLLGNESAPFDRAADPWGVVCKHVMEADKKQAFVDSSRFLAGTKEERRKTVTSHGLPYIQGDGYLLLPELPYDAFSSCLEMYYNAVMGHQNG